jgi:ketosteroid isomerase-like protein
MNRRTFACSLALLALSLPAAAESGAQVVDNAWKKAAVANDLEGLVKLYASDAVAWFPNTPEARGTEAIRGALQGLLGANTIKDVSFSDTTYRSQGNRSLGWGRFKLVMQPKSGGEAVTMTGRFTVVAEKRGKHWVYAVDHASADPPPPAKK